MILYNKKTTKMQQGGQAEWYNDAGTYNAIGQGASMVGGAIDQTGQTQYRNTSPSGTLMSESIEAPDFGQIQKEGQGAGTLKGIGTGAATGAALGSVVPGIGTAVGGVVGGIVGGVSGLVSARKKGKQRREGAEAQYEADVKQVQSNKAASTRDMYAQQYSQYQQPSRLYKNGGSFTKKIESLIHTSPKKA
jgi:gas vesicle protein